MSRFDLAGVMLFDSRDVGEELSVIEFVTISNSLLSCFDLDGEEVLSSLSEIVPAVEEAVAQELSVERVEFCTFVFNGARALCLGLVLNVDNEMPVEEELLVVFVELELLVVSVEELLAVLELLAVVELSVVDLSVVELLAVELSFVVFVPEEKLAVVELSVVVVVPEKKLAWHDWSTFAETFFGGVEFCSVDKFLFWKLFGEISAPFLFAVFGKFSDDNFVGLFATCLVPWILFDKFDSSIFGTFLFVCFGGVVGKLFFDELFVDEDVSVVVA